MDCRRSIQVYFPTRPGSSTGRFFNMAKSLRSKSQRKSRAILRSQVYKPVEDARTTRLSQKLTGGQPILEPVFPKAETTTDVEMTGSVPVCSSKSLGKQSIVSQLIGKHKRSHKRGPKLAPGILNSYGYSLKEIRF